MRICTRCILPDAFPGIGFDEAGVCNHCRNQSGREERIREDKKRYEGKFLDLLGRVRASRPNPQYDVLMAYSGGKDSTYTMRILREKYGLRILAFSFDNGFVSETAIRNIRVMCDRLDVDHIFFRPGWALLKRMFTVAAERDLYARKTLERASTICTSCIGLVKAMCLKTALERGIPMIGFGWSPGQAPLQSSIMKTNPSLARMTQKAILEPLRQAAGDGVAAYFPDDHQYSLPPEAFPYNVHPMAWESYEEKAILEEIKALGWEEPADTDTNSSNCLLNAFANEIHLRRHGYHPYAWEIANMVRDGIMTRQEGIDKIYAPQDPRWVEFARKKLGL